MLSFLKISEAGAATAREQKESAVKVRDIVETIVEAGSVEDEMIVVGKSEKRLLMQII